jgi:hypothetical protein
MLMISLTAGLAVAILFRVKTLREMRTHRRTRYAP